MEEEYDEGKKQKQDDDDKKGEHYKRDKDLKSLSSKGGVADSLPPSPPKLFGTPDDEEMGVPQRIESPL